ncbi:MAG: hypothetical protein RDU25_05285 [Patescibacteria group bacterium]|nr:hypothetical protein [Patescibacteria group bacterium]
MRHNFLYIVIISLISFGAGCAGQNSSTRQIPPTDNSRYSATTTSLEDAPQQLLGGDRDIHGCIGSAGYSWCESTSKCQRPWEEKCPEPTTPPQATEQSDAPILSNIYDFWDSDSQDCYFFENASYSGYDLLQVLQEKGPGQSVRSQPVFYTPDNVKKLNQTITTGLMDDDLKFRAVSTCHLASGLDVVSGVVWPIDQNWDEPDYKSEEATYRAYLNQLQNANRVLIVNQDKVTIIEGLPLHGPTVTGGDVESCRAKISDSNITWRCFTGMDMDEATGQLGAAHYTTWTLSREGEVLKRVDTVGR